MRKVYLETRAGRKPLEVSANFVQTYLDVNRSLFSTGNLCAIYLLFWILENMNSYNVIILSLATRQEFVSTVVSSGGRRYADQTVRAAVMDLIKSQLIVSMSEKGKRETQYMVNPMYFWKTSKQSDRMEAIKAFKYKQEEHERNSI